LSAIGALLGHASPVTTSRYSHLADDHLREVANRVGAVVAPPKHRDDVVPLRTPRK
jgi:integrase